VNLIESTDERLRPLVGDIKGQILVLNWGLLGRRFQMPRFQLVKAIGGFGCNDGSPGKIFGASICDGEQDAYRRGNFIGIATDGLITAAMADNKPVEGIDIAIREYLLIARDGSTERGDTVEQARQRLRRISSAAIRGAYEVHPESKINDFGFITYPEGAPPTEVKIKRGKVWTASH
jgi:hypothetical protein